MMIEIRLTGYLHKVVFLSALIVYSIEQCFHTDPSLLRYEKREELQADIDDVMRTYEVTLRALRTKRNACSSISQLPDEILEEIFWNIIDSFRGSESCVPASRVSQRWRTIALRSSRLWSLIVTFRPGFRQEMMKTFMDRARTAPLDVTLSDFHWLTRKSSVISTGLSQLHRMQHLTLVLKYGCHVQDIVRFPAAPAPHLQSIHLVLEAEPDISEAVELTALTGDLPALRHVTWEVMVPCHLSPIARPTVTYLTIMGKHGREGGVVDPHDLLNALRNMSSLEDIDIGGVQELALPEVTDDSRTIEFPHLRRIKFFDRIRILAWLLGHIQVRPTANIEIGVNMPYLKNDSAQDVSAFGNELAYILATKERELMPTKGPCYSARIHFNSSCGEVQCTLALCMPPPYTMDQVASISSRSQRKAEDITFHVSLNDNIGVLATLSRSLSRIHTCEIWEICTHSETSCPSKKVLSLLKICFPSVQTLSAPLWCAPVLRELLVRDIAGRRAFLPALTTLRLDNPKVPWNYEYQTKGTADLTELCKMLQPVPGEEKVFDKIQLGKGFGLTEEEKTELEHCYSVRLTWL